MELFLLKCLEEVDRSRLARSSTKKLAKVPSYRFRAFCGTKSVDEPNRRSNGEARTALKKAVKRLMGRMFYSMGFNVTRHVKNQLGLDPRRDMTTLLRAGSPPVIFDVGANKGQAFQGHLSRRHHPFP
jgi:hypothetical protein